MFFNTHLFDSTNWLFAVHLNRELNIFVHTVSKGVILCDKGRFVTKPASIFPLKVKGR